jgi:hypothetical protein
MALKLDPSNTGYAAGAGASQRALDAAAARHGDPKARGDAAMARRDWNAACESYNVALAARPRDGAHQAGMSVACSVSTIADATHKNGSDKCTLWRVLLQQPSC